MRKPPAPLDPWLTRFATAFIRAHDDSLTRFCDGFETGRTGQDLGIKRPPLEFHFRFD